jgi:hypothetical protein
MPLANLGACQSLIPFTETVVNLLELIALCTVPAPRSMASCLNSVVSTRCALLVQHLLLDVKVVPTN